MRKKPLQAMVGNAAICGLGRSVGERCIYQKQPEGEIMKYIKTLCGRIIALHSIQKAWISHEYRMLSGNTITCDYHRVTIQTNSNLQFVVWTAKEFDNKHKHQYLESIARAYFDVSHGRQVKGSNYKLAKEKLDLVNKAITEAKIRCAADTITLT